MAHTFTVTWPGEPLAKGTLVAKQGHSGAWQEITEPPADEGAGVFYGRFRDVVSGTALIEDLGTTPPIIVKPPCDYEVPDGADR